MHAASKQEKNHEIVLETVKQNGCTAMYAASEQEKDREQKRKKLESVRKEASGQV